MRAMQASSNSTGEISSRRSGGAVPARYWRSTRYPCGSNLSVLVPPVAALTAHHVTRERFVEHSGSQALARRANVLRNFATLGPATATQ